ncbi:MULTISPECIES: hypothetical protein [Methylobacteriaceae]|jgi:hypothetical protein|uniref:Uncharacterized protein n=2 Tax=Methylobacteriaceae TaxID=119045 RepID=A0ABU9ZJP7_9HYPH|nr:MULTISPECIES: hypothetical protein [Methylobacteriaceae]MBY0143918.1 hypothetical protein [Methylorubrum populi]MCX7329939.1 hypothetical protein [Hyphomicrobiales bacterium]MBB5760859.1 hypothetical protein [Methylorubrum rhodesianum]MBI1690995.1 hypothetical protein [Methylorubrum sp. DB1722]MBK3402314.1 hypothetical protein [Methylorubrum rhodesianum]
MRSLARLFAALAAVALAPLVFVWEGGRWVLRTVAGVRPDPVLPTAVAAEEYLDAAAAVPAPRLPTVAGVPATHPVGVALVMHARHLTAGGDPVDLSGLPVPVATWLHSLSPDELTVLARTLPHQAEALAAGRGRVPGLPGSHDADVSAEPVTHPQAADVDASAPAFHWPYRGTPADRAMADLLAHVEGVRARQARVA